jgi:hypothetical protein
MVSDRFFGPDELRWIRLLGEAMLPRCRITVLTSRKGQTRIAKPWEQTYKLHWRLKIAEGTPLPVEIVILGTMKDGQAPFHDRRIIVAGAGLTYGVSLTALGGPSDTTVKELTPEQAEHSERDLDEWARGGTWEYKGEPLVRKSFRLDAPDD